MDPVDLALLIPLREEYRELATLIGERPRAIKDALYGVYDLAFEVPGAGGRPHRCILHVVDSMGPDASGRAAQRLLHKWSPAALAMVGIAGGMHGDVRVGDVVVASKIYAYASSLKAVPHPERRDFMLQPRGDQYLLDHRLRHEFEQLTLDAAHELDAWSADGAADLAATLAEPQRDALIASGLVRAQPEICLGPVASGPVVGAARSFLDWLRVQDATLKALEMESAGLAAAAYERADRPQWLVIRGISDLADDDKAEFERSSEGELRGWAMRNATRLLLRLIARGLLPVAEPRSGRRVTDPRPADPARAPSQARTPASPGLIARTSTQEAAVDDLVSGRGVALVGPRSCGRTTLLRQIVQSWQARQGQKGCAVVVPFRLYLPHLSAPDGDALLDHMLGFVASHVPYARARVAEWEDGLLTGTRGLDGQAMHRLFQLWLDTSRDHRLLLAVDDFDYWLKSYPRHSRTLFQLLRTWAAGNDRPEGLHVLLGARHGLARHEGIDGSPLGNGVTPLMIDRLRDSELRAALVSRELPADDDTIAALVEHTGGHIVLVKAVLDAAPPRTEPEALQALAARTAELARPFIREQRARLERQDDPRAGDPRSLRERLRAAVVAREPLDRADFDVLVALGVVRPTEPLALAARAYEELVS